MRRDRLSIVISRRLAQGVAVLVLLAGGAWDGLPIRPTFAAAALRAGVAVVHITAERPSEPVRDPLLAKALVLEEGGNRAVILALDVVEVSEALVAEVRRGIREQVCIDPSGVLLGASHNHHTYGQIAPDLASRPAAASPPISPGSHRASSRGRGPEPWPCFSRGRPATSPRSATRISTPRRPRSFWARDWA